MEVQNADQDGRNSIEPSSVAIEPGPRIHRP
jgi:hypothetical protein